MKQIAVMHLHEDNAIYGAEQHTLSLFKYLPRESLRIFLGCLCIGGQEKEFFNAASVLSGIEVIPARMEHRYDLCAIGKIRRSLKKNNIQILHTHGYKADIIGFSATRFSKVKLVSTLHGWVDIDKKLRCNNFFGRQALKNFDRVITVSKVLENQAKRYIKKEKIFYVRNAVDTGNLDKIEPLDLNKTLGINKDAPVVTYVGRLSREKGVDYLVKAAFLVKDKRAVFLFIGDGPLKNSLTQQAAELGLAKRVAFTGYRDDALGILKASDLFVLPSLTEGISRSCMEAMGLGVLAVATNVGGMPELITDGQNGFLVPPARPEILAEKINAVLEERSRFAGLRQEAAKAIKEKFSMQRVADEHENLYSGLMYRGGS
ncbi:MAG: glycosyltransferase family 4 protein [Candidatus Omnitrophota bacterium]